MLQNSIYKMRSADAGISHSLSGPAWDNSSEYLGFVDPIFVKDTQTVNDLLAEIEPLGADLKLMLGKLQNLDSAAKAKSVKLAQSMCLNGEQSIVLLSNLLTYSLCALSTDSKNETAQSQYTQVQGKIALYEQVILPMELFLVLAPESLIKEFLNHPKLESYHYIVGQKRKSRSSLLSLDEEGLITELGINGHTAWGNLYSAISGTLSCDVALPEGNKVMSVAAATGLYQSGSEAVRKAAWMAVQGAWQSQTEPCAAILNGLAGWRLSIYKKRSHTQAVHFLDAPLLANRMQQKTLEAMFEAVHEAKKIGQRALKLKARVLNKPCLDPWDLTAPSPALNSQTSQSYSFDRAISLVEKAFAKVSPEMGEFVKMMAANKWIEAGDSGARRPGAYCTKFAKSRNPRVYMTYMGGLGHVGTLAHELGHAFHNWIMRDMPHAKLSYPSNLAETASIFAETVVNDALASVATSPEELFSVYWNELERVEAFLINIPVRFEFEKSFYEKREKKALSAKDFSTLMTQKWDEMYGNSVSQPDSLFWASKLHFHMSGRSFYNFPYTFGYLFSLGVYAQKDKLGKDFYNSYVALLRDTGSMDAEDVVKHHLKRDISEVGFWNDSISIVKSKVDRFEELITKLGF